MVSGPTAERGAPGGRAQIEPHLASCILAVMLKAKVELEPEEIHQGLAGEPHIQWRRRLYDARNLRWLRKHTRTRQAAPSTVRW